MKIHHFPDDEKSKKSEIGQYEKTIDARTQHGFILHARAGYEDKTKYFQEFLNARHWYRGHVSNFS